MGLKYKRASQLAGFMILFPLIIITTINLPFISNQIFQNPNIISQIKYPNLSAEEPNAKPLTATQYSTSVQSYFPLTLPYNVSFPLVEGWTSNNITILYEDVSYQKDWVSNGDFTINADGWGNYTNAPGEFELNDGIEDIEILIKSGGKSTNDIAYYEQNISIPEIFTSNKLATVSMDFYYIEGNGTPDNATLFLAVENNGVEINKTINWKELTPNYWTRMIFTYDPNSVGHTLPNNATIRAGVHIEEGFSSMAQDHTFHIDNVEYKIWTKPNQAELINAYDLYYDTNHTYFNSTHGKGSSFIDVERSFSSTTVVDFTIFQNITDVEDFEVANITITSGVSRTFNSTIYSQIGSKYSTNGNITWNADLSFSIPSGYSENWAIIEKPTDWNVTSFLDGYDTDRMGDCSGTDIGSTSIIISKNIFGPGLWNLEATSQNYISKINLGLWNGTHFINTTRVFYGDKFNVNVTLDNTVTLTNTRINCTIKYPNGTVFWEESKEPSIVNVKFGNFTVGDNMSVGEYKVEIEWTNNLSCLERTQVGYLQQSLEMWHYSNLTAVDSYIETVSGEPLLVKVNYTDYNRNTFIDFASLTYNSTFGQSGSMAYIGSGIYAIDLDTSGLPLDDYYLSFNASKSYYESQSINGLIRIKIITQPLALEVPPSVVYADANDYAVFNITVIGAESKTPVFPANVSTDWYLDETIKSRGNGIYTINVSTFEITTHGVMETFFITIYANKTNYGTTSEIFALAINPIEATSNINATTIEAFTNSSCNVKVNYTIESSGQIITGSSCSVIWDSDFEITTISNEFIIIFNTTGLSLGTHVAVIELTHFGYTNVTKSVNIVITPIGTEIVLLNQLPIEVVQSDEIQIKCRYLADGVDFLSGNISLIGDISGDFILNGSNYTYTVDTYDLTIKTYLLQILAVGTNLETSIRDLFLSVVALEIAIETDSSVITYQNGEEDNIIEIIVNDESHDERITDFDVICEYGLQSWELTLTSNNTFILDLNDLNLAPAIDAYILNITVFNPYGESVSTIFSVIVPIASNDINVIYQIIIIMLSIFFVTVIVGISSYIVIKKYKLKREKYRENVFNTYMDVFNLNYFMVLNKTSGLNVYEQSIAGKEIDATLVSGFLQAIRTFGIELTDAEEHSQTIKLDFQESKILMAEYRQFRLIFIMKENPSQGFIDSIRLLSQDIDEVYGKFIAEFKGDRKHFKGIRELLERNLNISLIYPLKVVESQHVRLRVAEKTIINKVQRIMENKSTNHFYVSYLMSDKTEFNVRSAEIILNLIHKKVFQPII